MVSFDCRKICTTMGKVIFSQASVCLQGVLCPGESLPRKVVSVRGLSGGSRSRGVCLCPGGASVRETNLLYGKERVVRFLLECILVWFKVGLKPTIQSLVL